MEQGIRMPKRRRGDGERRAAAKKHRWGQRLYLVFDDWPWGYSIREVDCSTAAGGTEERRLPRPFIRLEAPRGFPLFFSAVGTRIVATHRRNPWDDDSVPDGFLPIVDVRSRGVTFGPGRVRHYLPIYLPVAGDELFALDTIFVRMLSFKPLWPPRLENESSSDVQRAWRQLSKRPPFNRMEVTSYAVYPDDHTILISTTQATFAFDTDKFDTEDHVWRRLGEWSLPFAGRAYFVHGLDAFVGLSKDPATPGHLCSCSCELVATDVDGPRAWKLSKEKLFSEDPAENHVSATLLYMGGSEFCLVQCVSVEQHGNTCASRPHLYRLTTFSLSYDNNGDMTTGETCQVRCYRVPKATTERFLSADPVAFWL